MRSARWSAFRRCHGSLLAIAIAAPLIAGCTKAASLPPRLGVDETIVALAHGGVAVMADVDSTEPLVAIDGPRSAMRFTRWQVQSLVNEINAHGGERASDLDELVTPPHGVPPLSTFVRAWLRRSDGALAAFAARVMGDQDRFQAATVVVPTLVVLAFIADIARVRTPAASFDLGPWIAVPAAAQAAGSTPGGICTDVSGWVSTVVDDVTTAVQSNGSSFVASLWNTVVTIAGTAFSVFVNGVLQPIVGFITQIATIVGTITQIASMFKPWTVQLQAQPSTLTLSDVPVSGSFDATLSADDIHWPSTLLDCVAALSHAQLRDASYSHAPVQWAHPVGIPGLAAKQSSDLTLRDDKTAHFGWATRTVAPVAADDCPRLVPAGAIGITVTIKRDDVAHVIDSLLLLITNRLPAKLQAFLQPYEQPGIDAAKNAIATMKSPSASTTADALENVADPLCAHSPPPGATATPVVVRPALELPAGDCDAVMTAGDIAAAYPGDINLDPIMKPGTHAMIRNLFTWVETAKKNAALGPPAPYDAKIRSFNGCAIGERYSPPADPGPLNPDPGPDQPPIRAIFSIASPADDGPARTPLSSPACLDALRPQLERFGAECWIISSRVLIVFTDRTQYGVLSVGAPQSSALTFMRTLLDRLSGAH